MASSIVGAKNWIKQKALWGQRASLKHRLGLQYEPNGRSLTTKQTALNLGKALYYYAYSSIISEQHVFNEPAIGLIPAHIGPAEVARSKRPAQLDVSQYLLAASQNGASGSGSNVREKVHSFVLSSGDKVVVSMAEIALGTKLGERAVTRAVEKLKEEGKLKGLENLVYRSDLTDADVAKDFPKAKERDQARFGTFLRAIHDKVRRIDELPDDVPLHEIFRIINESKNELGIRFLDILVRESTGKEMVLFQQDVLPDALRIGIKDSIFEASMAAEEPYVYNIKLPEDNKGGRYRKALEEAGLNWEKDTARTLMGQKIERLMIFKGLSADKDEIQLQLVITNPVFFGKENEESVKVELNRLVKATGKKIGEIRAKKMREAEGEYPQVEEVGKDASIAPEAGAKIKTFHDLVRSSIKLSRFGRTLTAGRLYNPSTLSKSDQELIIEALNWKGRSTEDMEQHVINVTELEMVFYKGEPIAFASGKEVDHRNNGRSERMAYLIGTMVKDGFKGRSLQTVVNGMFLVKRWWRYKFEGGFFKTLRPMMRSRSVSAIAGFLKYFSGVVFTDLKERNKERADAFADSLECECDENGIVHNAYVKPLHDSKRDKEVLSKLKGKRKKQVLEALSGLGDNDARLFQAKFDLWSAIKTLFFMHVIFRLRNRGFEKRKN